VGSDCHRDFRPCEHRSLLYRLHSLRSFIISTYYVLDLNLLQLLDLQLSWTNSSSQWLYPALMSLRIRKFLTIDITLTQTSWPVITNVDTSLICSRQHWEMWIMPCYIKILQLLTSYLQHETLWSLQMHQTVWCVQSALDESCWEEGNLFLSQSYLLLSLASTAKHCNCSNLPGGAYDP